MEAVRSTDVQQLASSRPISQGSDAESPIPATDAVSAASDALVPPSEEEVRQSVSEGKKRASGKKGTSQASNHQLLASSSSGTAPLDETGRLTKVFRTVDTWAGMPSLGMLTDTYTAEKSFMGRDVSKEFFHVLFDGDDNKLPFRMDTVLAMHFTFTKASYIYYRSKFLINYLEAGKAKEPVRDFIKAIKTIPEWGIASEQEFKNAWYTLWYVLGFPAETDRQANSFQGQIHKLFPPASQKIQASATFSISLADLESVDLRVKPTENLQEHFLIEGNTVNIYRFEFNDIDTLHKYENNKAANALGIASLGTEIIASLYTLYAKDKFYDKAEMLGIFLPKNDFHRSIMAAIFSLKHIEAKPKVLAHRAHTLQRLVKYRRSWWPSLVRDIQKQLDAQPVLFYGAILAIFFGVCTVIQTVASVWALVLALRAA